MGLRDLYLKTSSTFSYPGKTVTQRHRDKYRQLDACLKSCIKKNNNTVFFICFDLPLHLFLTVFFLISPTVINSFITMHPVLFFCLLHFLICPLSCLILLFLLVVVINFFIAITLFLCELIFPNGSICHPLPPSSMTSAGTRKTSVAVTPRRG